MNNRGPAKWKIWVAVIAIILFAPNAIKGISNTMTDQANATGRNVLCGVTTRH